MITNIENQSSLYPLVETAKSLYQKTFRSPENNGTYYCTAAPGRVNLIGEHTDYTGGFVLPMAIDYYTICYGVGQILPEGEVGTCHVVSSSQNNEEAVSFAATKGMKPMSQNNWVNYIAGVVAQYTPGSPPFSFQIAIAGNVPLGAGLSSSASLEVSVATFIETLLGKTTASRDDKISRALKCQKAENTFCNSPCGIMDQFIISAAEPESALMIDCRSFEYHKVRFANPDEISIVVCNSNVTHSIAGGEYPVRVKQCQEATKILSQNDAQIKSLRDATLSHVNQSKDDFLEDVTFRRARHVVTENERVHNAKMALESGDWDDMGKLMKLSHLSMRNDYEVSCKEIDMLVDLANEYEGVYGSRLTGGGFGGCTVTLVKKGCANGLMEHLKREYKEKIGKECFCFETSPASGAMAIEL